MHAAPELIVGLISVALTLLVLLFKGGRWTSRIEGALRPLASAPREIATVKTELATVRAELAAEHQKIEALEERVKRLEEHEDASLR